ncbi:MAG: hypothetical protein AAFX65_07905 [Cyanobacteria bacterium J06638_7]
MEHPIWMLIPWAILAGAVGLKIWRFAGLVRQHLPARGFDPEQARAALERIWSNDRQGA